MQFLMCHDDIYQPIRSNILTREILPEVKDAFVIISREESHKEIPPSTVKTYKPQVSAFMSRKNDNNINRNNNWSHNGNNDSNASGSVPFTNEQVMKLMSILNDKSCSTSQANMAGDNQHMTNSTKDMIDLVDVSDLKIIVGHPNGTLVKITHVENIRLNNDVILFNVLVVPEYTVSLLSICKFIMDRKLSVDFDETICYTHDLRKGRVLRTGCEFGGSDLNVHQPGHDDINNATPIEKASPGLRRSSRSYKLRVKLNEYVLDNNVRYGLNRYANHTFLSAKNCCFVPNLNKSSKPSSFEEASKDPNWINTMNDEMHDLYENDTWCLTDLPAGRKPIGKGTDYEKTFSLVVKMETVRCLLSLVVQKYYNIFQMDVNNAFLYGELNEEVYMLHPHGFFNPSDKKVCRLKESSYGLKQAPRQWNHKLSTNLKENSFEQSKNDHSLFSKNNEKFLLFLQVYVNDSVITGTRESEFVKFKQFLSNKFKIKYLGELKHVLTPLLENIVLAHKESKNDKFLVNITNCQRLVGTLIYLTLTRPDISYVVHCLSQHMHAPLKSHFDISLRLLKYLKLALGYGIQFLKRQNGFNISTLSDSDWAKCPVTKRSVFGYCVFVNGCLVSWKSNKQATLSKSLAEAEYRPMTAATCEVMWIVKIMRDLNVDNLIPADLYCDNKYTIQIAANLVMHEKTKHFDIDVHLVREKVSLGLIKTVKVESKENVAHILTKALGSF
ncbi:ribonuclease H-like domain-containing protein [Tanacetum coccineum]